MEKKMFKAAYIAKVPDSSNDICTMGTGIHELTAMFVRDTDEAVLKAKGLAENNGVHSIILCPGFSNEDVARVAKAVGKGVSVNVSRGDGPSNAAAKKAMDEAGWFGSH